MQKQLFAILALAALVLCAFGASAQDVALYPEILIPQEQKIKAVWACVLHGYWHNSDLSAEVSTGVTLREWLDVPANRHGLSYEAVGAWPNVGVMQQYLYQNPEHPNTLRRWFFEMKRRVEEEIGKLSVVESEALAEYDGS